jgi:hypothetical protein
MYNGSTILLCVTIFVIHKQCLIRAHCSIVTMLSPSWRVSNRGAGLLGHECNALLKCLHMRGFTAHDYVCATPLKKMASCVWRHIMLRDLLTQKCVHKKRLLILDTPEHVDSENIKLKIGPRAGFLDQLF